jgi:hypothetical protein
MWRLSKLAVVAAILRRNATRAAQGSAVAAPAGAHPHQGGSDSIRLVAGMTATVEVEPVLGWTDAAGLLPSGWTAGRQESTSKSARLTSAPERRSRRRAASSEWLSWSCALSFLVA